MLETSAHAQDFYERMLALHGDRLNPGALWGAAITLYSGGRQCVVQVGRDVAHCAS